MSIHFANRAAAIADMTSHGWRQLSNGNWISRDKSCAAHILLASGAAVLVQIWPI